MAETRKSIIDEAFMEAESIDKAFKANAKEILAQTMSSEIEEMVKESLEEDWSGLKEDEDEGEIEDLEFDDSDLASLDAGDDLDLDLGDDEGEIDLSDLGDEDGDDVVVRDLTGEKNIDKVINVFKKMDPEDEIEVVQDGDNIDIKDNATGAGTLTVTGAGTTLQYIDGTGALQTLPTSTSRVQHQVKAGVAINKGQAVYVTSADGTNMIVGLASNTSEPTSSKTMGLLDALRDSGEDMAKLNKSLEEYVRNSRG